ncbi:MAG: N-alpha-acetyltransferase 10/11 [Chloroflexota bacterium]|nr:N-alpha-acetyltransferase 10/11 [Chloroflexota bacterium]
MNATSNYQIQPATWRDLFALSALEKVCFDQDAWPLLELMGVLSFPGVVRLKAVVNNEMVGFIAGDPRRSEKTGWILTLGVLPVWRRKGIGYDLLHTCEEQLGLPVIKLTVRRNNQAALSLYEHMGYQQVDIWSRYYRNGEDGLVLQKEIQV